MSQPKIAFTSLSAIVAIIFFVVFFIPKVTVQVSDNKVLGSVQQSNEYQSTTTQDWGNAGTFDKQLKRGPGSLAQVTITVSAATRLRILDADSQATAASATTTLASFAASPTVGTYTFDANFYRGLYAIVDGGGASLASTTITFR